MIMMRNNFLLSDNNERKKLNISHVQQQQQQYGLGLQILNQKKCIMNNNIFISFIIFII